MTKPIFLGGTLEQHLLFVVALCRFQHHTLSLAAVHYLTWSVIGMALHVLAFTAAGTAGSIVLAVMLTAWVVRLDLRVGLLFGLMHAAYAWTALAVLRPLVPSSSAATCGLALAAMVLALLTEVTSHHVLQGYGPRPPASAVAGLPRAQKAAFVPYFVVTFGLFFLTLDLAMRLAGHRSALHRRASAIARSWHEEVAAADDTREQRLHRRAVAELNTP